MKDVMALLGGVCAGAVGYLVFFWLLSQGLYGLAIPGGLIGLGTLVAKPRSWATPIICGVLGLSFSLVAEWKHAPFRADDSLSYFLQHIHQLKVWTLIMVAVGTGVAFVVPMRNMEPPRQSATVKE